MRIFAYVQGIVLTGAVVACSTPMPGDRIDTRREFDLEDEMPEDTSSEESIPVREARSPLPKEREKPPTFSAGTGAPTAEELFHRQASACRAAQRSKLQNVLVSGSMVIRTEGRKEKGKFTLFYARPGKSHWRLVIPPNEEKLELEARWIEEGFDGQAAWRRVSGEQAYFLDEEMARMARIEAVALFSGLAEMFPTARNKGTTKFAQTAAYRVDATTKDGDRFRLYMHRDTGMLLGYEHLDTSTGEVLDLVERYEDTPYSGFCFPGRARARSGEQQRSVKIHEVRHNVTSHAPITRPPELEGVGAGYAE